MITALVKKKKKPDRYTIKPNLFIVTFCINTAELHVPGKLPSSKVKIGLGIDFPEIVICFSL